MNVYENLRKSLQDLLKSLVGNYVLSPFVASSILSEFDRLYQSTDMLFCLVNSCPELSKWFSEHGDIFPNFRV